MNIKFIFVAVYFCCVAASAEGSVGDEHRGTVSYLGHILQFPLSLISWDKHSDDTDDTSLADGGHPGEEVGGILSFLERLLLFPVCLTEESDLTQGADETRGGVQICKAGFDSHLLEYVIETGQHVFSDVKTKILETCSLFDWQHVSVPFHYLQSRLLYSKHSSLPLPCRTDTPGTALPSRAETPGTAIQEADDAMAHSEICVISDSGDEMACTWSTWTLLRYMVAGIVAMSLLPSSLRIDTRRVKRVATRLLSLDKDTSLPDGRYRTSLSPIPEHPSDVSLPSMIVSLFSYFPSKLLKGSAPQAEYMQKEHFPMCEYFDIKTCNCGGKPVCRELSPKLGHFKMCEFFDSLPCNCGGVDSKADTDPDTFANILTDVVASELDDTHSCDRSALTNDSLTTKEQSVQAVPDTLSRDTSPEPPPTSETDEDSLTDDVRMLQLVQRAIGHCVMCNYPAIKQFQPELASSVSDNDKRECTEEGFVTKTRGVQADDMTQTSTNNGHVPLLIPLPVNHCSECEDPKLKLSRFEGESNTKAYEIVNFRPMCQCKDPDDYGTTPWKPSPRFASNKPAGSKTEGVMGCSRCISDLMKCYETKLKSDTPRAWTDTIRPLKLNQEFITRLNTLLSAGYKIRYFYANRFKGNPIPYTSIHHRCTSDPPHNGGEINKETVSQELAKSGSKTSVESDQNLKESENYENEVSPKKVHFIERVPEVGESQPNYLNDDLYDDGKLSEHIDNRIGIHENMEIHENMGIHENRLFGKELEPAYSDVDSFENGKSGMCLEFSTETSENPILFEEHLPEYLEDDSHENYLSNTDSDIGSPCHNSSFKDNSPYTTADTVSFADLRACGDGVIYSTLTRRSPYAEAGLGDLSVDMSVRESEESILDVSDINSNLSFNSDAGILEVAVIFAMQTMWRLAKRFWQQSPVNTSHNAVAIEKKENGLFVIRQKEKSKSYNSSRRSMNNSASVQESSGYELDNGSLESQTLANPDNNRKKLAGNLTGYTVDTQNDFDTLTELNDLMDQESYEFSNIWFGMNLSSESSDEDFAVDVIDNGTSEENDDVGVTGKDTPEEDVDVDITDNSNNNARFHRKRRDTSKRISDYENSSDREEWGCSNQDTRRKGPVIYKSQRPSEKFPQTKYDRDDNRKHYNAHCHSTRRARADKKQTTQITSQYSTRKETRRRLKRTNQDVSLHGRSHTNLRRNSMERYSRSSQTALKGHCHSSASSSDISGNFADESSSSSDENSNIGTTFSKIEINDVASCEPSAEGLEKAPSCDNKPVIKQENSNACACKICRCNERQIQDILDQLLSLHCNVWELRDFRYVDRNDNTSTVLAWAWSCVETE